MTWTLCLGFPRTGRVIRWSYRTREEAFAMLACFQFTTPEVLRRTWLEASPLPAEYYAETPF